MLFYQELVYNYTRIKDVELQEGEQATLFLFVELSIKKVQELGDKKRHQEITVVSEVYRTPLDTAPRSLKAIPMGDYFIEVSKEKFEYLEKLSEDNFIGFLAYQDN